MPFTPGIHQSVNYGPVDAGVGVGDVNLRQFRDVGEVKLRIGSVLALGLAVKDHGAVGVGITQETHMARLEGFHAVGVGFGDVASGLNFVIEHDQSATSYRVGGGSDANGVQQVIVGVSAHGRRRPHSAGYNDGPWVSNGKVQEVGRFFQRWQYRGLRLHRMRKGRR